MPHHIPLRQALADAGAPTPWRIDEPLDDCIVDAAGDPVLTIDPDGVRFSDAGIAALAALILRAVNRNPPQRMIDLVAALQALPDDDERLAVLSQFCRACGSTDTRCHCANDE